jgi:hypothetical protein
MDGPVCQWRLRAGMWKGPYCAVLSQMNSEDWDFIHTKREHSLADIVSLTKQLDVTSPAAAISKSTGMFCLSAGHRSVSTLGAPWVIWTPQSSIRISRQYRPSRVIWGLRSYYARKVIHPESTTSVTTENQLNWVVGNAHILYENHILTDPFKSRLCCWATKLGM